MIITTTGVGPWRILTSHPSRHRRGRSKSLPTAFASFPSRYYPGRFLMILITKSSKGMISAKCVYIHTRT